VKLSKERPPLGARLESVAKGAFGWLATLAGVLALIWLLGKDSGWAGSLGRPVVAVAVDGLVVLGVVAAVAYVVVRHVNKRHENVSEPSPLIAASRRAQSRLGAMLGEVGERVDEQHGLPFKFDQGNMVLSDATRITAATLAGYDGLEKIRFLWSARPAQGADFLESTQFAGLPAPAQDAVVLLDLRRELLLRGLDAFRSASSGFYCHDLDRIALAAQRTGNAALFDLLESVRTAAPGQSVGHLGAAVLDELDKPETWEGMRAPGE
jgi:hypothetical protein